MPLSVATQLTLRHAARSERPLQASAARPFNAILSFGYGMLFALVHRTLLGVGLEPSLGFYHQPRSAAPPLVLDLVEIFRVPLVDIPTIGSVNRNQSNPAVNFTVAADHIWLSDDGRKKAIGLFEERLNENYKHPFTGQSLAYARIVELEARSWKRNGQATAGLFARMPNEVIKWPRNLGTW